MSYQSPSRGNPSGSGSQSSGPRAPPSYHSIRQDKEAAQTKPTAETMESASKPSQLPQQSNSILETVMSGAENDTIQKLAMLAYVTNPEKGQSIMQGLLTAQVERQTDHLFCEFD